MQCYINNINKICYKSFYKSIIFSHKSINHIRYMSVQTNQKNTNTALNTRLLYKVLDITNTSDSKELKRNYLKLCMKYHPDHTGNIDGTAIKFLEIKKAFDILNNNQKKKDYDTLSDLQHDNFDSVWKTEFHDNKEKIAKLDYYIKKNSQSKG